MGSGDRLGPLPKVLLRLPGTARPTALGALRPLRSLLRLLELELASRRMLVELLGVALLAEGPLEEGLREDGLREEGLREDESRRVALLLNRRSRLESLIELRPRARIVRPRLRVLGMDRLGVGLRTEDRLCAKLRWVGRARRVTLGVLRRCGVARGRLGINRGVLTDSRPLALGAALGVARGADCRAGCGAER